MSRSSPYLSPAAAASGLLISLSLPNLDLSFLAWVALVPLLVEVVGRGPAGAARAGFAAGLVHAVTTVYWVTYTMHTYGGLPWAAGAAVMLLLAAYLAAFPAAWAAGVAVLARRARGALPVAALLVAPPLWAALEWLRSWVLTGFPWMLLGYSQYRRLGVIQVADLGGVYAVSFLVVAGNVAAYSAWRLIASGLGRDGGPGEAGHRREPPAGVVPAGRGLVPRAAGLVAAALVLVGASLAYGRVTLARVEAAAGAWPALPVGIVQGSIDQAVKWEPEFQAATIEIYRSLTAGLAARGARLVVWPETAVPAFFQTDPAVRPVVLETARAAGVDLLFGAPSAEPRPPQRAGLPPRAALFNSAYLVGTDGAVRGRYDKQHLVPFGEYVPLSPLLFLVGRLAEGIGDFEPGRRLPALTAGPARLGVLICYEAIFPGLARRATAEGANLLVNITNDAWFGRTAAPWQHLAQAALRAAELKRPLVRAANTGVSAIVAPTGRIEQTLTLFTRGTLAGIISLPPADPPDTLYARIGDRFAQGCLLAAALALLAPALKGRPRGRPCGGAGG